MHATGTIDLDDWRRRTRELHILWSVGPFSYFTAIIGPTGCKKSNVMDGPSPSCLEWAQRLSAVRSSMTSSMLSTTAIRRPMATACRASILHFIRDINIAGGSGQHIDGHVVNWEDYNAKLISFCILIKARRPRRCSNSCRSSRA